MGRVLLKAVYPNVLNTVKESFVATTGKGHARAELQISSEGVCSVAVYSYGISENAVRRSSEYAEAYRNAIEKLIKLYELNAQLYLKFKKINVNDMAYYLYQKNSIQEKKYVRRSTSLTRPNINDVKTELQQEFSNLIHNGVTVSETYVQDNIERLYNERVKAYDEAVAMFNDFEDKREQQQNDIYHAEYVTEISKLEDFINGDTNVISDGFSDIAAKWDLPYEVLVDYKFNKVNGQMEVDVEFQNGMLLPQYKASILSSGKLSIKQKSTTECANDLFIAVFNLVHCFLCKIFNISPAVNSIRLTLWYSGKIQGLAWFQVDRNEYVNQYRNLSQGHLAYESMLLKFPYVLKTKSSGDLYALVSIPQEQFVKDVNKKIKEISK